MVKRKSIPKAELKECYGTNEWSENSGICRNCKLKENCGKISEEKNEGI